MFEFLATQHLHTLHMMHMFMHSESELVKEEEQRMQHRFREEYAAQRRSRQAELSVGQEAPAKYEQIAIAGDEEYEEWLRHRRKSYTVAEISKGTGLGHDQIRQAMKSAEDQFVHWPHPEHPDMTRYALREHAAVSGLKDWRPGIGF